jgi:hypothetical protein
MFNMLRSLWQRRPQPTISDRLVTKTAGPIVSSPSRVQLYGPTSQDPRPVAMQLQAHQERQTPEARSLVSRIVYGDVLRQARLSSIRPSIGTENPIPEKMDHRKITVRVPVMNKVQLLFASEPCKLLKPRSL